MVCHLRLTSNSSMLLDYSDELKLFCLEERWYTLKNNWSSLNICIALNIYEEFSDPASWTTCDGKLELETLNLKITIKECDYKLVISFMLDTHDVFMFDFLDDYCPLYTSSPSKLVFRKLQEDIPLKGFINLK